MHEEILMRTSSDAACAGGNLSAVALSAAEADTPTIEITPVTASVGSPDEVAPQPERRSPRFVRGGIRTRVVAAFVVLLAVALAVVALATRQVLLSHLDREIETELAQEVEEFRRLAQGVNPETGEPFGRDAGAIFDTFLARNVPGEGEAFFAMLDGRPYAWSFDPPARLFDDDALVERWADIFEPTRGSVSTDAGQARYLAVPLISRGEMHGVFAVALFPDLLADEIHDAIRTLLFVSVAVLVVATILAWSLAGRVVRPVWELTTTAQRISETDLSARIAVMGTDEVAELSETFNEMLDRLEHAFRSQREVLDDVAHELRTPITIVRGHLELLGDDPLERRETVALVTDELDRMSRYVNDLLLLASAEQPNFLLTAPIDFSEFAETVLVRVSALAPRRWVLERAPDPGTLVVVADEGRLVQAMTNLAANAVRVTEDGDEIRIGVERRGDDVALWVRDFGPGIAPAMRERLFARYSRAPETARGDWSTGLGLAIVSAIADAHEGSVDVASEPGRGALFTIVIPRVPAPANRSASVS
jgi:signal transduction histidine kinase